MTGYGENDLDFLLRNQFAGPVDEDGFSARVMARLPARQQRIQWPMFAGTFAGLIAYWLSLWTAPISFSSWQDWVSGRPVESVLSLCIVALGIAVSALGWALSESDDERLLPITRRTAGI